MTLITDTTSRHADIEAPLITPLVERWSPRAYDPTAEVSTAVLVANVAETADAEGTTRPWARFDLGQAVAHLTIQAQHEGLHTHQMGGFDGTRIAAAFGHGEHLEVVSITAIGMLGDADALPEPLREREVAPRRPLVPLRTPAPLA